jgi:hypothetical protein
VPEDVFAESVHLGGKELMTESAEGDGGRLTPVLRAAEDLQYTSNALSREGYVVASATVLNATLLTGAIITPNAQRSSSFAFFAAVASSVLLPLILIALLRFDRRRRRGDAVFEELSDELQWYVKNSTTGEASGRYRPDITVRRAMREFVASSTLPLTKNYTSGIIFYLGLNALISFFSVNLVVYYGNN